MGVLAQKKWCMSINQWNVDFYIINYYVSCSVPKTNKCSANADTLIPLGIVAVLNFSQQFPQGWERLNYQEAQSRGIIQSLKQILEEWSIVAFQQGKMAGSGYGYEIQPTYGG